MFLFFRNPAVRERTPEEKRFYFLNVFSILGGCLALPHIILYFYFEQDLAAYLNLGSSFLFFLSAYLNKRNHSLAAKTLFSFVVLTIVFLLANNSELYLAHSLFYIPVFCSFFIIHSYEERYYMYI